MAMEKRIITLGWMNKYHQRFLDFISPSTKEGNIFTIEEDGLCADASEILVRLTALEAEVEALKAPKVADDGDNVSPSDPPAEP